MPTERRLSDFEGRWRLEKSIQAADGGRATFSGEAVWCADAGGLDYVERGLLTLGQAAPVTAERRYFWRDGLHVFFEDGRFFHAVPIEGGAASHDCPPDRYDVIYDFAAWPCWRATWRVKGPRKDYEMTCDYKPLEVDG